MVIGFAVKYLSEGLSGAIKVAVIYALSQGVWQFLRIRVGLPKSWCDALSWSAEGTADESDSRSVSGDSEWFEGRRGRFER